MNAKISRVAIIAVALVVAMGMFAYLTLTPSVAAATNNNPQTSNAPSLTCSNNHSSDPSNLTSLNLSSNAIGTTNNGHCQQKTKADLTVGQVITLTSTSGEYRVVGNSSETGTASGTLTLDVTGNLTQGYILNLTGGSIVINGTSYTITSGSAETGPYAQCLVGQGYTTPTGDFLMSGTASGNFGGATAQIKIDFSNGTTEYGIVLSCTVQG